MVKVKNTGDRKEAVHTTSGVVFLHPGQERDLELSEPGAKLVEASDALTTGGKQARKRPQKAAGVGIMSTEDIMQMIDETSAGKP